MNKTIHQEILKHLQQGSYMLSCKNVENNNLITIQGKHSLQFLICISNNLNTKYSTKHLVRFLLYLTFDNLEKDNLLKYISALYYILVHLIEQVEWKYILELKSLILPSFTTNMQSTHKQYYVRYSQKLIQAISKHKDKCADHLNDIMAGLLETAIKIERVCKVKDLLSFLYNLSGVFQKQGFNYLLGTSIINTLIEDEIDLVTPSNFKKLVFILKACFLNPNATSSKDFELLVVCVDNLLLYLTKTKVKDVMEYLKSNLLFFKELDNCNYDLSETVICLEKLHRITKVPSLVFYLVEVVYFCLLKFSELMYLKSEDNIKENMNIDNKIEKTLSKNFQQNLSMYFSLVKSQSVIIKKKDLERKCCGCSITKMISKAIYNQINAFNYVKKLLSNVSNSSIPSEVYETIYKLISKSFELLNVLLKANCKETTDIWVVLGSAVYNLCIDLFNNKRHNENAQFLEIMTKGLFIYGGDKCLLRSESLSSSIIYCYIDCLISCQRYNEAMDMCALAIYTYSNPKSAIINAWNTIIYQSKSEDFLLCDILEKPSEFLFSISNKKKFSLNNKLRSELYMNEIQNYVARYKSISRIEKCFERLVNLITPSEYILFLITLPFDIITKLKLTLFVTKASEKGLDNFQLAIFKYFSYKHKYLQAISSFKLIPKSPIELKSSDLDDSESDKSETVACNYMHIRTDEYEKFAKLLKDSITLFNDKSIRKLLISESVLDLIITIAKELELHGFNKEIRIAWGLAYNIAIQLKANRKILHIITYLIQYKPQETKEILEHCKTILNEETIDSFNRCIYFSSLARHFIQTNQLLESHENYLNAESAFYELGGSFFRDDNDFNIEKVIAAGHFALLMNSTEFIQCNNKFKDMHHYDFDAAANVLQLFLSHIKKRNLREHTEFLTLLFTLGENIIWKYLWCGMLVAAERFTLLLLEIAENSLLTFRVCKLLVFLAKIHYHNGKTDNCQVTIDGLWQILHLSLQDEDLNEQFKRKVLIRSTSPIPVKKYKQPTFVTHENCNCVPCSSNEFQNFVIETMHLELLIVACTDNKLVEVTLNKIFKLIQTLECNKQFQVKDVQLELLWTAIFHCQKVRNREKMWQYIDILKSKLGKPPCKNFYLYNHLMNLIMAMQMKQNKYPEDICKTPEIKLKPERSPQFLTPTTPILDICGNKTTRVSDANEVLTVPNEFDRIRMRLRSRNLQDRFNNEKQTPKPDKKKETDSNVSSSKQKGLR